MAILFCLRFKKWQYREFGKWYSINNKILKYDRVSILRSPFLKEDLAMLNGALLFALSILFSGELLKVVGINTEFSYFIPLSIIMGIVWIRETRNFMRHKLDYVTFYYHFKRNERPIAEELFGALKKRDWVGAGNIVDKANDKGYLCALKGGICKECGKIRNDGPFCYECGKRMVIVCEKCDRLILTEEVRAAQIIPTYCSNCGNELPKEGKELNNSIS